ncbi:MAG: TetR/AcrR family transcriptional regulator [Chloroflexi bacterium]|nr:TetR/AcrR family transcriptional regulator [Chloroflexota bacterium]
MRRIPKQKRSKQRVAAILDAAEALFAVEGYEQTTTNAIAARADVPIASLYQYFENKEGVAQALIDRYVARMVDLHEQTFAVDVTALPLDTLLDQMIDPFVRFHLESPAFGHLMLGADLSNELAEATARMDEAVIAQINGLITAQRPDIAPERALHMARLAKAVVKALFALVEQHPDQAEVLVAETKRMFRAYLES